VRQASFLHGRRAAPWVRSRSAGRRVRYAVARGGKTAVGRAAREPEDQTCNDTNIADPKTAATIEHGSMGMNVIRRVHGDDGQTLDLRSFRLR